MMIVSLVSMEACVPMSSSIFNTRKRPNDDIVPPGPAARLPYPPTGVSSYTRAIIVWGFTATDIFVLPVDVPPSFDVPVAIAIYVL